VQFGFLLVIFVNPVKDFRVRTPSPLCVRVSSLWVLGQLLMLLGGYVLPQGNRPVENCPRIHHGVNALLST